MNDVNKYVEKLSEERKFAINRLRDAIKKGLPEDYIEIINYDMISYVIPLSIYPKGYHRGGPLTLISLASQKNYIALYHMGIYADHKLLAWFKNEYKKYGKLDMGKSCIRFKKLEDIPYHLIEELCSKISVEDYINMYENS